MKTIFALMGSKGSGKDTYCKVLLGNKNYKFSSTWQSNIPEMRDGLTPKVSDGARRFAFADELKRNFILQNPQWSLKDLHTRKEKIRPHLIQHAKKECKRRGRLVWCEYLEDLLYSEEDIIITDLRFIHENEYINRLAKRNGWNVIRIRVEYSEGSSEEEEKDTSETEFLKIKPDAIVHRNMDQIGSQID